MAEKKENPSVYGYPVEGEKPIYADDFPPQKPGSELVSALAALIDMGVARVMWTQYTPYFNDGDVCTFSAHEIQVYARESYDEPLTRKVLERVYKDRRWDYVLGRVEHGSYEEFEVTREYEEGYDFEPSDSDEYPHPEFLPDSPVMEQALKVNRMITSGSYDQFLGSNFGDGTQVTFDGKRFTFDEYSHD